LQLAYFKFNETSGTNVSDATSNGWTATLVNSATWSSSGHSNYCVNLSSNSYQYVSLPNNITTNLNDFTIATWVYLTTVAYWTRIFDFGVANNAPIPTPVRYMYMTPMSGTSGALEFSITAGGSGVEQRLDGKAALTTGTWHHVAVTVKGNVGVLYADGVAVGTNSAITFTPDGLGATTQNCIGRSQFSGDPYLNGKVDDFRIYNGALSAAQIAALVTGYGITPNAPTNVTATAVSASQINLTWNTVSSATNYDVLRSTTNGGTYTIIATGITATNYSDTALAGGTTYYYVVTALSNAGSSTNSTQASATTLTPPDAPTGLTATGVFPSQIILSWTAGAGAMSYNVKRAYVSSGAYVTIATGVTTAGYTNTSLTGNVTYYYVVSSVNANGESTNSTEANATPPVPVLTWQGAVNTNWDISVTTNWVSGGAGNYYQDGAATVFNDTTTKNLVNLVASVSPYSVTFSNSTLSYTVSSTNGSGIGGSTALTKWGTGTVTLNTTNTFTGNITNNAGTVTVAGAGLLGGGNYAGNIVNYGTMVYGSMAAQTLSGVISQTGALTKNGTGALTLSGVNTYSGTTTVNAGSLALAGSGAIAWDSPILIGNTSGSSAALIQSSANSWISESSSALGAMQIGSTVGGYGYYNLSAGTLYLSGEIDIGGSSGGAGTFGQFDMGGGYLSMPSSSSSFILPNRGAAGECSVVNIAGGTVAISGGGTPTDGGASGLAVNWSSSGVAQTNVTTISGSAVFNTPTFGVHLNVGGNTANVATLNLNGGTLMVKQIVSAAGASTVNFNGGTLMEGSSSGVLFGGGAVSNAFIYSGGATINDNGYSVAVGQNLSAPTGNGVASIPVSTGGAGYAMPPQVIIIGGSGSGATAYATVTNGAVTGIIITCPSTGYSSTPTAKLVGGGYTTAATLGTVTTAANTSGGLTKTGSGTVSLSGTNTYTGTTVISNGTLKLNGPVLHFTFDNVVGGSNVINDGSGGSAMNGLLTGTNVSIISGGRSGKALMVSNGPPSTGYVVIPNAVVPLNITTPNNWTIALWLKTSTAGGVYLYQGDGSWAQNNTEFYLENGTAGDGAGIHAGGVRSWQGWESGTSNIVDGAWHFMVMTCNNGTKAQYVDGAVDALAINGWSGAASGSQMWIGGAASGADSQVGLNGLIDEVYIYDRVLGLAEVTNLMNSAALSSRALPAASAVTVASGATLDLNGYNASIGGLNGGGTVNTTGTNFAPTLTISNSASASFSGTIKNSANLLSLIKTGSGTQTLSGTNTYSGTTTISNGELVVSTVFAGGGNFVVKDGASLGVTNLGNAQSASISNLTLGVSGTTTLEFLNVSNLTKPLIQAAGSLTLNGTCTIKITGTNNLVAGSTYPLIGYSGSFNGSFSALQLSLPSGFAGVLISNANSVALNLIAAPAAPAGLTATAGDGLVMLNWNAATNASSYYVKNSTTNGGPYAVAANLAGLAFTNTGLANGTNYYFVVTATNSAGESTNSFQVSARPVSAVPPQLTSGVSGSQLQFTWPPDHTGWRLQVQTNPLTSGLGTNWQTVPNSTNMNQFAAPISPTNGGVFFRLVYP
jgi:autotransporter-associated beta strand protein